MIKIIFSVLLSIYFLVFIFEVKVTLNPFSFSVNDWRSGIGVIFLVIGYTLISWQIRSEASIEGARAAIDEIDKNFFISRKPEPKKATFSEKVDSMMSKDTPEK